MRIKDSTFINAKFEDSKIVGVNWTEADLAQADCRKTDFSRSRFMHTDLSGADFRDAKNYIIHPALNKLSKAKFSLPEAMSLLYCLDIVIS